MAAAARAAHRSRTRPRATAAARPATPTRPCASAPWSTTWSPWPRQSDCDAFGPAITTWIDGHRDEIATLISAAVDHDPQETLAELDAWVETHRLAVLEKAADCADSEDAWPAWQHFDAIVNEVRAK